MLPPSPEFALLTCMIACVVTVIHSYGSFCSSGFDKYAMCLSLQNNTGSLLKTIFRALDNTNLSAFSIFAFFRFQYS